MAGPGGDLPAGAGGRGHLRASHADRDQVIRTLKAAFVQGMLTKDEFDFRVGQTFASRTYAELAAVIADIPAGLRATIPPAPPPPQAQAGQPVLRPGSVLGAATAAYAAAWAFVLTLAPDSSSASPLITLGGVVYLGVLLVCVAAIAALRRERRSGGQPPKRPGGGDQAHRRFPSSDQSKRLPPGQHGRTDSTQVGRGRASLLAESGRGHPGEGARAAGIAAARW
jgi:hypothetical protein